MFIKKLTIAIMFFISFYALQAHDQKVHQYIVIEAYKLLKMQLSLEENGIGDIDNWIGSIGDDAAKWSEINSIAGGSSHEDDYDAVYGYGWGSNWPDGLEMMTSVTHFWDPDDPYKPVNLDFVGGPYPTSYEKAYKYLWGGWEMKVFWGSDILYCSAWPIAALYSETSLWVRLWYDVLGCKYTGFTWNCGNGICRKLSYNILGRLCHLLADKSVPAHIHMDAHGFPCKDWYEDWFEYDEESDEVSFWDAEKVYEERGGFINPFCDSPLDKSHGFLWYTVGQIADYFASNRESGDDNYDEDIGEIKSVLQSYAPENPIHNNPRSFPCPSYPHTVTDLRLIRDVTFPYVIRATAGLLYQFILESKMLHPEYQEATFGSVYNQILELSLFNQTLKGNHYMFRAEGDPGEITVCPNDEEGDFIIEGTARNVTFRAAQKIVFKDGFVAKKGSDVHAYLFPECEFYLQNPNYNCQPCLDEEQNPKYNKSE